MTYVLIIAIIVLLINWWNKEKKLQSIINDQRVNLNVSETERKKQLEEILKTNQEKENLFEQIESHKQQIIALNKYQGIVDTENIAKEILINAEQRANSLIDNANQQLADSIQVAGELNLQIEKDLEQAEISAKKIKTQATIDATTKLDNATREVKLIIEQAEKKAQEIAGDAYKAMQNASELEKTAKAMKNIIDGYGDRYLVPTYSLLDDLAEEFGHTDAGEKLKYAREKTRLMIKNGTSAKCDYVEANRKNTAVNFILDAFNGKVDSILSKVKKDNFGTLEQKIKDAFQVVNNNGKAFRNAVITQGYLIARMDELKWAVITQELKWEEQEEQRRIKEQIREEEKARRDFEKAMREAQKEEEALRKLIEKAQKEISQANQAQKAMYEERLIELEARLKIAEEKNQRAMSMAQQTKSGNVYIISNIGSFGENVYKIGMTRRLEPIDRVRELGGASVPFEFDVHAMIFSNDAPAMERLLHKKFLRLQMNKVNPRKEFFKITLSAIIEEIEKMNINAKWTMTAEAKNYRETLLIEQSISNDIQKQLEWENHQLQIDPVSIEEEEEIEI